MVCVSRKGRTQIEEADNTVLRKIFGPETEDITEGWKELHIRWFKLCVQRIII
jgi:hypothetical protein